MTSPKIRFKQFQDEWEEKKIWNNMFIKARIGWQALTKKEYLRTWKYYLITWTDINDESHLIDYKKCYYVSKERFDKDVNIQVKEWDIIITKDWTIWKIALIKWLDKPATLNSHLFVVRDLSWEIYNIFLLQILTSFVFEKFISQTKTWSTLTGLPQKTFVEFTYHAPSFKEQKKIWDFLQLLDTLVTKQQDKLDKLKQIKQWMLQKLFPKKWENLPEIRFSGFNDKWNEKILWEITNRNSLNKSISAAKLKDIERPWGDVYLLSTWNFEWVTTELLAGWELYNEEVIAIPTGWEAKVKYCNGKFINSWNKLAVAKNDSEINLKYLYYVMNYNISEIASNYRWASIKHPDMSAILNISYLFPLKNEQDRITSLLTRIDEKIITESKKLDKLRQIKLSLLQKMFI